MKSGVYVAVGIVMIGLASPAVAQSPNPRPGPSTPVTIVNTPLPVTGTVSGQVEATIVGIPQVTVVGAPAPEPFHLNGDALCTSGDPVKGISATNNTGKLMVVENVSFMVQIRKGFSVTSASIALDSGLPTVVFSVLPVPQFGAPFSKYGGAAMVKAYIPPGRGAFLDISETSNGDCNLHFEVSGILVNP